jgi:hypothetical protein
MPNGRTAPGTVFPWSCNVERFVPTKGFTCDARSEALKQQEAANGIRNKKMQHVIREIWRPADIFMAIPS